MTITDAGRRAAGPFFTHAPPGLSSEDQPQQNATRYLCAAAYLDKHFCDSVIREYVDDEHRAVVPSFGFDLEPVILHALRARRLRLFRDLAIAAVWVAGWILAPLITGGVFLLALPAVALYLLDLIRRRPMVILVVLVVAGALIWLIYKVLSTVINSGSGSTTFEQDPTGTGTAGTDGGGMPGLYEVQAKHPIITAIVLLLVFSAVVLGHLAMVLRTLARDLAPGAIGRVPASPSERVRRLLTRIASAQRGNVTLYSSENPFMGAGDVKAPWARAWSIVLELDRAASGPLGTNGKAAPVDPVAMHARVRSRLQEMRDEWPPRGPDGAEPERSRWLPPNERIAGLVTDVHVVGRGECAQRRRPLDATGGHWFEGHPLIDAQAGIPYSVASPEAIEAIVRHPQGGVRCYQRVMVGAQGQAILGRDNRPLAPAEDQDIALSAFVYLAVEGRMLYGQFVATVLPPIRREFRIVDVLPTLGTAGLLGRSVRLGWKSVPRAVVLGWFRVMSTLWWMGRGYFTATTVSDPAADMVHDYGARISVRELAADADFHTFMQELDADKYTRLIERRVNEAVLDYLSSDCGIDVSAYRDQASVIMNEGVIMTGGSISGQVAVGGNGSRIEQKQGINP